MKVLKVGVEMGGLSDEDTVPLPDNWNDMSADEQEQWADGALDVHLSNTINAWWNVEEA